jgi:hypothetical protein
MKELKKFMVGITLTMVALFIMESVYNWKESKAAFMEAYHAGCTSELNIVKK